VRNCEGECDHTPNPDTMIKALV